MALCYTWNKGKHQALTSKGLPPWSACLSWSSHHHDPASLTSLLFLNLTKRTAIAPAVSPVQDHCITVLLIPRVLQEVSSLHRGTPRLPNLKSPRSHPLPQLRTFMYLADVTLSVCSKNKNSTKARTIHHCTPGPTKILAFI